MRASDILTKAAALVGGDRERTHGPKLANFSKIAAVWNGVLEAAGAAPARPLDAHDVANLMESMKIARRYEGDFNVDDYIDGGGYAGCAGEIRVAMIDAAATVKPHRTSTLEVKVVKMRGEPLVPRYGDQDDGA